MMFAAICSGLQPSEPSTLPAAGAIPTMQVNATDKPQRSVPAFPAEACAGDKQTIHHPVFHIIEEPGGIRYLTECEVPTEEYNTARIEDLARRYPKTSPGVIEHLSALEPFLDTSILAGFSYGVSKASIMVQEGSLLGHVVGREGSRHEEEKTEAIDKFAPLKDVTQIRQFVGKGLLRFELGLTLTDLFF